MLEKVAGKPVWHAFDVVTGHVLAAPILSALAAISVWALSNLGFALIAAASACLLIAIWYLLRHAKFEDGRLLRRSYASFVAGSIALLIGCVIHARESQIHSQQVELTPTSIEKMMRFASGDMSVQDLLVVLSNDLMSHKLRRLVVEFHTPTADGLRVRAGHGFGATSDSQDRIYRIPGDQSPGTSVAGLAWKSKSVQYCTDSTNFPAYCDFNDEVDRVCGKPRSILAVPVVDLRDPNGAPLGVLCAASSYKHAFDARDMQLLTTYARALSHYRSVEPAGI